MLKRVEGWGEFSTTKKGDCGEELVKSILRKQGYCLYIPEDGELAHPYDLVAFKDKDEQFYVEVKVKRHREKYPDTGIDYNNWIYYDRLTKKHSCRCFIFFVDTYKKQIYGNYLDILEQARFVDDKNRLLVYPQNARGYDKRVIRYYPLEAMIHIANLTEEQCKEIDQYETKKNIG